MCYTFKNGEKMNSTARSLRYQRDTSTVVFNENIIVDLNMVPRNAKAKIHSAFKMDSPCVETIFTIDDSNFSFHIEFASFNPKTFIRTIVENHLEVEGMVVYEDIQDAYDFIVNRELRLENG